MKLQAKRAVPGRPHKPASWEWHEGVHAAKPRVNRRPPTPAVPGESVGGQRERTAA